MALIDTNAAALAALPTKATGDTLTAVEHNVAVDALQEANAATRTANTVLAGPASGGAAAASFRALVAADVPAVAIAGVTGLQAALDAKADDADLSAYETAAAHAADVATLTAADGVLTSAVAAKMANPMTTAADLIVGGASGAPARLAKGAALQVLRMNAAATAHEYADPAAGGGAEAFGVLCDATILVGVNSSTSPRPTVTGSTPAGSALWVPAHAFVLEVPGQVYDDVFSLQLYVRAAGSDFSMGALSANIGLGPVNARRIDFNVTTGTFKMVAGTEIRFQVSAVGGSLVTTTTARLVIVGLLTT